MIKNHAYCVNQYIYVRTSVTFNYTEPVVVKASTLICILKSYDLQLNLSHVQCCALFRISPNLRLQVGSCSFGTGNDDVWYPVTEVGGGACISLTHPE